MVKGRRRTGDPRLYEVAQQFLERGFRNDDSVFTPGRRVWTAENLAALDEHFVRNLDESKRSFEDKLRDQLQPTSDGARQLMAELFCFHLLVSSMITVDKKRELVQFVLGLMDQPVEIPSDVVEAFGVGIVNPGTYFNTGRWVQLCYLVELGARLKSLPEADRNRVTSDPRAFKEVAEDTDRSGVRTQVRATLHLLFPETFEAIVSDTHVTKILERFAHYATADDPDRQLDEIREALTPEYGDEFDFYDERLRPLWEQGIDPWPELLRWAGKLQGAALFDEFERDYKVAVGDELAGVVSLARGGQEFHDQLFGVLESSEHNLIRWQTTDDLTKWFEGDGSASAFDDAVRSLWLDDGPIAARVQAFADSLGDAVDAPGERTSLASFLLLGVDATAYPIYKPKPFTTVFGLLARPPSNGQEGERYERAMSFCEELVARARSDGLEFRDSLDAQGVVWSMANVTPDSRLIAEWSPEERQEFFAWRDGTDAEAVAVADKRADVENGEAAAPRTPEALLQQAAAVCHMDVDHLRELEGLLDHKGQVVLYGPPGTGKTFVAQELAHALVAGKRENVVLVQFHPSTTYEDFFEGIRPQVGEDGALRYDVVAGPLARLAEKASANRSERFVMIIDELNRANLPKVLGELLFLFEYRNRAATTLYRPDRPFSLPENLWFIATMNTVDRSVALVDAAMRRRFHFFAMYPDEPPIDRVLESVCDDGEQWVAELVERVNAELADDLGGRDHKIGPSHFINATRSSDGVSTVWRRSIEPLIEDQLFGQEDRVRRYRWDEVVRRHSEVVPDATLDQDEPPYS